ncbi:hypothetical protein [Salinicoccus halodurans]|uniref:Uncharacterized protein n=1 Tax=Salinicoccus halodurans TaxID=407035 RepID=A0A0F7D3P3_9STAP|nr:hypothetical protein [Salinicoccus halodurans]AKG72835.1 hypothetical protein AAT16_00525 [Salinicoccus halodurans]SFK74916.1 hypothetical protein SAMN05216235_1471 [Salinicoccus halodurans]
MYANQETIHSIQNDLYHISTEYPELYMRIQHVTSFARQLQVKYRYLADLITDDAREPEPRFIKASVLDLLVLEVDKLKETPHFEIFLKLLNDNRHSDAPEIFLLVLGARKETVVNNAIIS